MVSGIAFILNQKNLSKTKTEVFQSSEQEFKQQELDRMQQVYKSVPNVILGLSIALLVLLLALIFFINSPFWKGVSYGVLIYFLGLLITESISYLSVKNYLESLLN